MRCPICGSEDLSLRMDFTEPNMSLTVECGKCHIDPIFLRSFKIQNLLETLRHSYQGYASNPIRWRIST